MIAYAPVDQRPNRPMMVIKAKAAHVKFHVY